MRTGGDSEGMELDRGRQQRLAKESLRRDSSSRAKEFTENKNVTFYTLSFVI